tara:strand:- start:200 stop:484 length:285 start_codon:yes stop_codon:yes gene_type:complete
MKHIVASPEGVKEVEMSESESNRLLNIQTEWAAGATDRAWEELRLERNGKLAETDWWAMPDSPTMSEAQTQYRQDLRDFPSTVDINNIVWPTKP